MKKAYTLLENDYRALCTRYNTLVRATEIQNGQMVELRAENVFYRAQLGNADKRIDISRDIVVNNIVQSQEEITKLSNEIIALQAEVKSLKSQLRS